MSLLSQPGAELYVPDGGDAVDALARTTHLAIGAHQDDLEIMAIEGILACYGRSDAWFTGVVVTDGRGSPRTGPYAGHSDDAMVAVRAEEQRKAAHLGDFSAQALLGFPSSVVKDPADRTVAALLLELLEAAQPRVVYAHSLADKHDTHVAVTLKTVDALRALPRNAWPERVIGCEVWRDLDWLDDADKVIMDASEREGLQAALLGVFDSQIVGGKRYDLAAMGRRRAHATFHQSHGVDRVTGAVIGMDLTPLLHDPAIEPADFVARHLERFQQDVVGRVRRYRSA